MEEADRVRDLAREAHLVGRDHHRHALLREVAHEAQHLVDELRVERGGDLVEEEHLRLHRHRARDRDALLLAAAQLVGIGVCLLLEPDPPEQDPGALLRGRARDAADLDRRDRHVPHHAHVREQVEALEHEPDLPSELDEVHPGPGDDVALEADLPALDRLEPVDAAEERRLTGARRADQADHLVRVDREADALQHLVVRIALPDGVDLEQRHQSARTPVLRACRAMR